VLTPRQRVILSAIVEDYVRSAEPVGSRTLSKHINIPLSPATIRNEMADLEDMGYLDQPHTSAGRIPSQKGYRFYVDNLMMKRGIEPRTLAQLRALFRQRMDELEHLFQQTSLVLSELTQYTAIVLGPKVYQERIKHVQLVPLSPGRAVAILVTDTGHVEDRYVQFSEAVAADDIVRLVNFLNDKLAGVTIASLKSRMVQEMADELARTIGRYEDALAILDEIANVASHPDRVYVGGTANILAQPEFRDLDKVLPLLSLLERADAAGSVLPQAPDTGVQVRIGQENEVPTLQNCTVVSATYTIGGVPAGRIGILGPTRMNYARVVEILEYVSDAMTRLLSERLSG
jgi:heat-inducible transcriptional repressor